MSAVLSVLLLTTPGFAQTKGNSTANSDPVVCFDDVLRDAENALQAYSIALTKSWAQEADCRGQAPSATELGSCWDLLLQARPLISQAGNLNEQARRMSSPADADRLSQQAGALMRQAADLVRKARDCFNPVFAQWQKNGGRYIAAKSGTSDSGASSVPQVPPSLPPIGPPGPAPRRPAASQPTPSEPDNSSSPAAFSVRIAAQKAADTIIAGNDSRAALGELNKAQQALPPGVPRPIECWGTMVDAQSKRAIDPNGAIQRAQKAVACYEGWQGQARLQGRVEQNVTLPSVEGGALPLPDEVRKQLLQRAAEMDRLMTQRQDYALAATNHFFECLVKVVKADLVFLAQPGYVPAAQIAQSLHQGVWNYITTDAWANNQQMFRATLETLRRFKEDPACWFANAAPGAAAAAITHLAGAAVEAAEVQKAADSAVRLANVNAERRAAFGTSSRRGTTSANRYNPDNAANMCFPCALAQDLTWATGDSMSAKAFAGNVEIQIIKGVPTKVYNITHQPTVESLLSGLYGSKKLQGPSLSADRLQNQMWGRPSVSSYQQIVDELRAAGPNSRGLVFLEYPTGPGHVVNTVNVGDTVMFPDASNSNIDGRIFFQGAGRVFLFRTQ